MNWLKIIFPLFFNWFEANELEQIKENNFNLSMNEQDYKRVVQSINR